MKYFSINYSLVDNPLVVQEAHKPVVQNALIRICGRLKSERTRRKNELLTELHMLPLSDSCMLHLSRPS